MNLIESLHHSFITWVQTCYPELSTQAPTKFTDISFSLNIDETRKEFGDVSSNAALIIAKEIKKNPREVAQKLAGFTNPRVQKIEIAGPGFLNLYLTQQAYVQIAQDVYAHKKEFFKLDRSVPKKKYSLEFVSANPTGPLHLGHGRGAIIGDVLGNILNFIGHTATKEFYINDAGAQIQKLGMSLKIRCQQVAGESVQLPEDAYHGEYLVELAKACIKEHGKEVLTKNDAFFSTYAKDHLLTVLKNTLAAYGVHFDVWFSEKSLHTSGEVEKDINKLTARHHTYEKDGALWFKATDFGDDKDRVLRKSSGEITYVAAEIAYLESKIKRGFDHLIMVLGQDHHSYVVRLKSVLTAMGHDPNILDVILYQLVSMKASGELVRMSKRAGNIVTLEDVIDTVGKDVARFFYLNRKADAHLDFDIELALKKTDENPVYYIQYAYVRINSILQKAQEDPELSSWSEKDIVHVGIAEHQLLKKIISLKELLISMSHNYQTHLLAYYAHELAQHFHRYYSKNRVMDLENIAQSKARLVMLTVLKDTFETVLDILGLSKPEKM